MLFLTVMIVATTGFSLMPTQKAAAQQVDFGSYFVNRYVWRGIDFGKSASIQPYIEFSSVGFTAGTWASYAISPVENSTSKCGRCLRARPVPELQLWERIRRSNRLLFPHRFGILQF